MFVRNCSLQSLGPLPLDCSEDLTYFSQLYVPFRSNFELELTGIHSTIILGVPGLNNTLLKELLNNWSTGIHAVPLRSIIVLIFALEAYNLWSPLKSDSEEWASDIITERSSPMHCDLWAVPAQNQCFFPWGSWCAILLEGRGNKRSVDVSFTDSGSGDLLEPDAYVENDWNLTDIQPSNAIYVLSLFLDISKNLRKKGLCVLSGLAFAMNVIIITLEEYSRPYHEW